MNDSHFDEPGKLRLARRFSQNPIKLFTTVSLSTTRKLIWPLHSHFLPEPSLINLVGPGQAPMGDPVHSSSRCKPRPNPLIANEINAATAPLHHTLNTSIVKVLPGGLPPDTTSPALYILGILPFASIYAAFEDAFGQFCPVLGHSKAGADLGTHDEGKRLRQLLHDLAKLRPDGIQRTPRLRADVRFLQRRAEQEHKRASNGIQNLVARDLPDQNPYEVCFNAIPLDARAAAACETWLHNCGKELPGGSPGWEAVDRIHRVAAEKPHVLIAYAWVWYMAIFAGGRWIRGQLDAAGRREFWEGHEDEKEDRVRDLSVDGKGVFLEDRLEKGLVEDAGCEKPVIPLLSDCAKEMVDAEAAELVPGDQLGYSYLSFCGDDDGDDIREDFKARLANLEELLTQKEREDIVAEAKDIFESSIRLVQELNDTLESMVICDNIANGGRPDGSCGLRGWTPIVVKLCVAMPLALLFWALTINPARGGN